MEARVKSIHILSRHETEWELEVDEKSITLPVTLPVSRTRMEALVEAMKLLEMAPWDEHGRLRKEWDER